MASPFTCPICQEDCLTYPVATICGHVFCWTHLHEWFQAGHSNCPVCSTSLGGGKRPLLVISLYGGDRSIGNTDIPRVGLPSPPLHISIAQLYRQVDAVIALHNVAIDTRDSALQLLTRSDDEGGTNRYKRLVSTLQRRIQELQSQLQEYYVQNEELQEDITRLRGQRRVYTQDS